jgi:chorismate synthase
MGCTYLDPSGSQIGKKESIADTARVLGRMYDGIEYRGFGQEIVEELAKYAGVPVFNGLTNNIAQLLFGIPDISGVEFGAGFSSAEMAGSQYADNSYTTEQGYSATHTNSHGGIINGITSGMPVVLRAAFHPPKKGTIPCCNIPRAVVYVESAVNTALLSAMLDYPNFC